MKNSARRRARHITIFLDVDGVLNSYPVKGKRFKKEGRKEVQAWNYVLHYRPKIVKALEKIVEQRDADIVWLSTWSALCRTEIEPKLNFQRAYPIIEMPDATYNRFAGDHTKWWKAIAVKKWLTDNPGKRAVWVDDDLAHDSTREYFAQTYRSRLLMIAPVFQTGLDEDHIKSIEEFSYPRPDGSEPVDASDFVVAPPHDPADDREEDADGLDERVEPTFTPVGDGPAGPDPTVVEAVVAEEDEGADAGTDKRADGNADEDERNDDERDDKDDE